MAPIKYEEQLKETLEKRNITPSSESWATLSDRLDAQQKNKNRSLFWWFGIAASIVGIVFITTLYFNNQPIQNASPIVVDSFQDSIQYQKNETIDNKSQSLQVAMEEVAPIETSVIQSNSKANTSNSVSDKNGIEKSLLKDSEVVQVEKYSTQKSIESVNEIKNTKLTFEDQKIQDVVAQIRELNANGQTVSSAEIDSLLKKAQKEILNNRLYDENTRTVDANDLLQDVEADLQQSFRSKVFEALQSGYESVKTAVAERNN